MIHNPVEAQTTDTTAHNPQWVYSKTETPTLSISMACISLAAGCISLALYFSKYNSNCDWKLELWLIMQVIINGLALMTIIIMIAAAYLIWFEGGKGLWKLKVPVVLCFLANGAATEAESRTYV